MYSCILWGRQGTHCQGVVPPNLPHSIFLKRCCWLSWGRRLLRALLGAGGRLFSGDLKTRGPVRVGKELVLRTCVPWFRKNGGKRACVIVLPSAGGLDIILQPSPFRGCQTTLEGERAQVSLPRGRGALWEPERLWVVPGTAIDCGRGQSRHYRCAHQVPGRIPLIMSHYSSVHSTLARPRGLFQLVRCLVI